MKMSRKLAGIAALATGIAAFPFLVRADEGMEHIKKSFPAGKGGQLTLTADLGSIEVRSAEGNTVEVDVQIETRDASKSRVREFLKDFNVDFSQTGNDVTVRADYQHDVWNFGDWFGRHIRVKFMVIVPNQYNVDLKTSGGGISVSDLKGTVRAATSGGSLTFGHIDGPIFGKTSGGGIRLEGCNGEADVRTSGGSIHLGKVAGDVNAHTSGGSISVNEAAGTVNASTSGGSINVTLVEQPKGNCRFTTSGGSITANLSEKIGVDVDASTSGGRVSTDFPVQVQGDLDKHHLRAEINGGGPELYLRTSGGSIHLKRI
jgi:DUF4097 and DUF4098 domain-containing protein YvlB